jgi:hypothetical protein
MSKKLEKIENYLEVPSLKKPPSLPARKPVHQETEETVEISVRFENLWNKEIFTTICKKHGLSTYRFRGQKYTTCLVRTTKSFLEGVLWTEFLYYAEMFSTLVEEILDDVKQQIN